MAFGSTCHGAGRVISRQKAARNLDEKIILRQLRSKGIEFKAATKTTIIEEAPETYKDIEQVVNVCENRWNIKKSCTIITNRCNQRINIIIYKLFFH